MPGIAPLRLVERCYELVIKDDVGVVPYGTRGIYVLYKEAPPPARSKIPRFDVVYIGLAAGVGNGVRGRLYRHRIDKPEEWTHFSVFSVWPNIREEEIRELEGLLRHIFRFDTHANRLNIAKGYNAIRSVRMQSQAEGWMGAARSDLKRTRRTRHTTKKAPEVLA